ncbi:tryptophan-rich sensory protein [Geodermatophilus sp. DF01-2]|uniref:TspO/MBR family protein n=1 Tax=Geodermatophilus sp. DF01-2 TaxID=2559610 RepID=UPI0010735757|nr:TspO/MBR family protein [Geodermatophilus sp. DF01_2]TFV64478.1 tryptophan-rich sensory protein [Geodermatophilus sp. DF01_2]
MNRAPTTRSRSPFALTSAAVGLAAVAGTVGTDVTSRWYRHLDKPPWQPPGWAFGAAWTTLYAMLAWAGGRALVRSPDRRGRRRYLRAYAANLVLNSAWTWVFFRAERPRLAAVESAVLTASTVDLTRRTWRLDPAGGAALLPYGAWVLFATALTGKIARRNPRSD